MYGINFLKQSEHSILVIDIGIKKGGRFTISGILPLRCEAANSQLCVVKSPKLWDFVVVILYFFMYLQKYGSTD